MWCPYMCAGKTPTHNSNKQIHLRKKKKEKRFPVLWSHLPSVGLLILLLHLKQWFSTFPVLWPFNTDSHVVVTPNHKMILLLLRRATVMNCNVITVFFNGLSPLSKDDSTTPPSTSRKVGTHRMRTTDLEEYSCALIEKV